MTKITIFTEENQTLVTLIIIDEELIKIDMPASPSLHLYHMHIGNKMPIYIYI